MEPQVKTTESQSIVPDKKPEQDSHVVLAPEPVVQNKNDNNLDGSTPITSTESQKPTGTPNVVHQLLPQSSNVPQQSMPTAEAMKKVYQSHVRFFSFQTNRIFKGNNSAEAIERMKARRKGGASEKTLIQFGLN